MTEKKTPKSPPITREKFQEHLTHLLVVYAEAQWNITADQELTEALYDKCQEFLTSIFGEEGAEW